MTKEKKAPKPKLTREQKAALIFEGVKGRKVEGSIEEDFVTVNSKGGRHIVRIVDEDHAICDCMDFIINLRQGGQCKHILAAYMLYESQKTEQYEPIEIDRSAYEVY